MAKILCRCGALIPDQTDYLPYKAHLLADQDHGAGFDEHPDDPAAQLEAARRHSRRVFQCDACGRLVIDDRRRGLLWFRPEDGGCADALGSVLGRDFPVCLRARWQEHPEQFRDGSVFWGSAGDRPGGFEKPGSAQAVEALYAQVKAELIAEGRLRDALLVVDGEIRDRWPVQDGASEEGA